MKTNRLFILLLVLFSTSVSMGQTKPAPAAKYSAHERTVDSLLSRIDTLLLINNQLLDRLDLDLSLKNRFKLYQTENIYNLLQLDTKTGRIEQVQWSLDDEKEGTMIINSEDLSYGHGYGSGCFELYPTKNMYQFILMDKTDGRMWHVQWGIGSSKRWIQRIF